MSAPELTAEQLATVARFEQAPDALGLREEVAETLARKIHARWCNEPSDCSWGMDDYTEAKALADALLPLIERREAEAVKRALYEARDALYRGEGPDMVADSDIVYGEWLGNRADRIGGDSDA